jgi:hypothetical protein
MHTTNYFNTFIEIAEDSPTSIAEVPPLKGGNKTAAYLQFEMVIDHPYKYTSDDVLFHVFAVKNNISKGDLKAEREKFFSKGQPCLRASPLTKRYGWGVHANEAGKIALYGVDSDEYKKLAKDKTLQHVKAMRSKRK